jgi:hypothetical protein
MKTKRKPVRAFRRRPVGEIVATRPYSENEAHRLLRMGRARMLAETEAGHLPRRWDGYRWIYLGSALLAWLRGDHLKEAVP